MLQFIHCSGVVIFEVLYCLGVGSEERDTFEVLYEAEKLAEFQMQALVECPAFLRYYSGCRGFH